MRRIISFEFLIIVVIAGLVAWVAIQNYTEKEVSLEDKLIENMKMVNKALDEYKKLSGGILPSRLDLPVSVLKGDTLCRKSVIGRLDPARGLDIQESTSSLLYGKGFENPYNPKAIAVMTVEDSLESKQPGIVYYIPEGIMGNRCMKCKVVGSVRRGFLEFELHNYSEQF
jgi:hypothetical protein